MYECEIRSILWTPFFIKFHFRCPSGTNGGSNIRRGAIELGNIRLDFWLGCALLFGGIWLNLGDWVMVGVNAMGFVGVGWVVWGRLCCFGAVVGGHSIIQKVVIILDSKRSNPLKIA